MMESTQSFISHIRERYGYSHIEEIGRGGMGVVFKAHDPHLERYVAVKQLSTDLVGDDSARARFTSEMKTLARISHSAVVNIHSAGITDDGSAYFIMDYVKGRDLSTLIRERTQWGKAFSVEETVDYLGSIALALDHLHLKMDPPIIHRDIKPANILIPSGDNFEARSLLTDFGISLTGDQTRLTSLSIVAGTERYIAPELYPGATNGSDGLRSNSPDAASDNYALALVALQMLTTRSLKDTMSEEEWTSGDRPFPRLQEMGLKETGVAGLAALEEVFRTALNPRPAYRYATANEFIQALARAGDDWAVSNVPAAGRPEDANAPTSNFPTADTAPQMNREAAAAAWAAGPHQTGSTASTAYASTPTPAQKKPGSWTTVGALGVIAIALAAGVGYLGYYTTSHPAWNDEEATIAAAFPEAIPALENGTGWADTVCSTGRAEDGQEAQIVCENDAGTVTYIDYGTVEARDEAYAQSGDRVGWEGAECSVQSTALEDDSYSIIPGDPVARFAAVITGDNAGDSRLEVPLC